MATPSLEDFEAQLEKSLEVLGGDEGDIIFDRSPLDFIGYALCLPDAGSFDVDEWLPKVQAAVDTLDLVIFVPIEARDAIFVPKSADRELRLEVDEKLREIILDDSLDLGLEVLEVSGNPDRRRDQVLNRLAQLAKASKL